jgi:hypothetical protein
MCRTSPAYCTVGNWLCKERDTLLPPSGVVRLRLVDLRTFAKYTFNSAAFAKPRSWGYYQGIPHPIRAIIQA